MLPLLKPATFELGDLITTPKVGTREMSFIIGGEVQVRTRLAPVSRPNLLAESARS